MTTNEETDCDISIGNSEFDADNLAYTLIHELGHCLGLGHAHVNYKSIMGYSRSTRSLHLGGDDMAGIIFLYPDPSIVKRKENIHCGAISRFPEVDSDFSAKIFLMLVLWPFLLVIVKTMLVNRKFLAYR